MELSNDNKQTSEINYQIVKCEKDEEIMLTFPVMSQLRPHLDKEKYVESVNDLRESEKLTLMSLKVDGVCLGAMTYRIKKTLFRNLENELYIDDLVVDSNSRSKGYGKILLDFANEQAKILKCKFVTLDSGIQREQAHKFYLREGLSISSYHFTKNI